MTTKDTSSTSSTSASSTGAAKPKSLTDLTADECKQLTQQYDETVLSPGTELKAGPQYGPGITDAKYDGPGAGAPPLPQAPVSAPPPQPMYTVQPPMYAAPNTAPTPADAAAAKSSSGSTSSSKSSAHHGPA